MKTPHEFPPPKKYKNIPNIHKNIFLAFLLRLLGLILCPGNGNSVVLRSLYSSPSWSKGGHTRVFV